MLQKFAYLVHFSSPIRILQRPLRTRTHYETAPSLSCNSVAECTRTKTVLIDKLVANLDRRFPADYLDTVSALGKVFDVNRYPAIVTDDNSDTVMRPFQC